MTTTAPAVRRPLRRRVAVLLGLVLSLFLVVPVAPFGLAAPFLVPLGVMGLLIALGSAWHGVIAVVAVSMLVPRAFSIQAGPVSLTPGRTLLFALVIGWLAGLKRPDRPILIRRTPIDPMIAVLTAALLASTIANLSRFGPGELLESLRRTSVYVVDYFALFFIAVSIMRNLRNAERLVRIVAALIGVIAAFGLLEHLTGRNVFTLVAPTLPGGVGQFLRDVGANPNFKRGQISRVRGTAEGPLAYGAMLAMGLPLLMCFTLQAKERLARIRWGAATAAVGLAIILTASRSIYLLTGITFVTLLILLPNGRQRRALAMAGGALVLSFLSQTAVRETMLSFVQPQRAGGLYEGSIQARVDDYEPVLRRVAERPFLGYGPRSFAVDALAKNQLIDNPGNLVLDNAYLFQFAEGGVIGLAALIALLVAAYSAAYRAMRRALSPEMFLTCLGLFAAMQSWILMGFVADVYQFNAAPKVFFVLLAAVGVYRVESGWAPPQGGPPGPPPAAAPPVEVATVSARRGRSGAGSSGVAKRGPLPAKAPAKTPARHRRQGEQQDLERGAKPASRRPPAKRSRAK